MRLNNWLLELQNGIISIIKNMAPINHVLKEVSGIQKCGWKADFANIVVDMMFAFTKC